MRAMQAPAKVNLCLAISGRRSDGYHLLESIMVPISVEDRIDIAPSAELTVSVRGLPAPTGHRNLVYRVADAFRRDIQQPVVGAQIRIEKHIPVAAGLGGGSADAAAALRVLNELWGAAWPLARLAEWAVPLGADLPFCLYGVPARVTGIGERVEPLTSPLPEMALVLVTPQLDWPGPKTATVFTAYDAQPRERVADAAALLAALNGGRLADVAAACQNDLEATVMALQPAVVQAKADLLAAGVLGASLSGSGPTVFGLARDVAHARAVLARLPRERRWVTVATVPGTNRIDP